MHNAICRPRTAFNDGRLRDIELTALVDDDVDRQLQLRDDRRRTRAQLEDDLETNQSAERENGIFNNYITKLLLQFWIILNDAKSTYPVADIEDGAVAV